MHEFTSLLVSRWRKSEFTMRCLTWCPQLPWRRQRDPRPSSRHRELPLRPRPRPRLRRPPRYTTGPGRFRLRYRHLRLWAWRRRTRRRQPSSSIWLLKARTAERWSSDPSFQPFIHIITLFRSSLRKMCYCKSRIYCYIKILTLWARKRHNTPGWEKFLSKWHTLILIIGPLL